MNIFKNMLFQQGYLHDPRFGDDVDEEVSYAEGYGNRVLSEKTFAPLGHDHAKARRAGPTLGNDPCPTGACG